MRRRPFSLFLCALLFLFFPAEFFWQWQKGAQSTLFDIFLFIGLPLLLLVGLIKVTRFGWYTLIAFVSLWGVQDLYQYYSSYESSISALLIHLIIYCVSLGYFINPRVRHLYFDPRLRWWRTKPRYETHLPFLMKHDQQWHYPLLRNISQGGCFIETAYPIEVGKEVGITIPLPIPLRLSVITARGEVRWISRNPLRPGIGVQFQDPGSKANFALKEYVARQL